MTDLERMLIEHACARLCLDYAYHADRGEGAALGALFADDAELALPTGVLRGPAAIGGNVKPVPGLVMRHVNSNIRIEAQSADAASGVAYIALYYAMREGESGPAKTSMLAPRTLGAYHDRFTRTPAGWRFAQRRFEPAFEVVAREAAAG